MTAVLEEGEQVRVIGDHPWTGCRARVISGPSGALRVYRCALLRDDAMDGHEIYARPAQLEVDA